MYHDFVTEIMMYLIFIFFIAQHGAAQLVFNY